MKKHFTILLIAIVFSSCNKEDISPIISNPAYSTILLANALPDNTGSNNSTLQDAIILEDGRMLVIINYTLYSIENNNYTEKANTVFGIKRTNDGKIYVLGEDAIYTSIDNGESFTVQERFVAELGQSYALDLYYNGKPNNILVKKTPDGSYVLWLYTQYNYNLGGTGFTQKRYSHFVFTSANGLDWNFNAEAGTEITAHPTAIDNNGKVYIFDIQGGGGQTPEEYFYYTSTDLGVTKTESNAGTANAISNNNALFSIDRIAIDTRFKSSFQQWDGQNWVELNPTIDQKAMDANSSQLIIDKVSFTPDGKMLLINSHGLYLSDSAF